MTLYLTGETTNNQTIILKPVRKPTLWQRLCKWLTLQIWHLTLITLGFLAGLIIGLNG